ncbi:hypothetical protein GCM10023187_32120 [Nibrella viscosa]|uniref:Uncharacterized protein n=1 Tax=Nibrella viscosa TaxID=1084524 RepID=A0ABP8KKF0_9BACT
MTHLFWWYSLPRLMGRVSRWWALVMTDGYFLITLPVTFTRWLSPALLVAGFACGWFRPGYVTTPAEAPLLFCLFLIIGILSGHLGLLLLIGFAAGDLLTTQVIFETTDAAVRAELLVAKGHEYIIFGLVMVQIPLTAKQLTGLLVHSLLPNAGKRLSGPNGRLLLLGLTSLLQLTLSGYLVFLWAQAMVLLLRTTYLHFGWLSSDTIGFFQIRWPVLVWVAVSATLVRLAGQWSSILVPSVAQLAAAYEAKVRPVVYRFGRLERLPKWLTAVWNGLFLTFLLWGAFLTTGDMYLFFVVATLFYGLRAYLTQFAFWPGWMRKLWLKPPVWRLVGAVVLAIILIRLLMPYLYQRADGTFWPVLIPSLLCILIFGALLPVYSTKPNAP